MEGTTKKKSQQSEMMDKLVRQEMVSRLARKSKKYQEKEVKKENEWLYYQHKDDSVVQSAV